MKLIFFWTIILFFCIFTSSFNNIDARANDQLQVNLSITGDEKPDGNYSSISSISVHVKADNSLMKEVIQNTPDYGPVLESWLKLGNKPPLTGPKLIYRLNFYSPDSRSLYSTDIVFFARKYSVVSDNGQKKPVTEVVDETNIVIPVQTEINGTYKLLISQGNKPIFIKNIVLEKDNTEKQAITEKTTSTNEKINKPKKISNFSDFIPILLTVIGILLIALSFFIIVLAIKKFPRKPEAKCPFCHKTLFDENDTFCCYCGALLKPEKKQANNHDNENV
ncbi:hypothetical protein Thena_0723 [Thermodesulfobium narugense DSM 14796]|uniref:Zinc-ribbon domain-containing protein n=1 Tax=Thermodesulfobium narugense DSM 14796 TaxID=747365 RepID=M1E4P2_9BACT|nr:hypothetical protein [Thermodesulfobium narugense]AEE14357.1 hypothetical protein Thena_0723 [Thermodesulfobium narugense DSM 14796]